MKRRRNMAAHTMLALFALALTHSAVHMATEYHVWCPKHQRVVHITASRHNHEAGQSDLPSGHEARDACKLFRFLTTATTQVSPWPALVTNGTVISATLPTLVSRKAHIQQPVYRLAPAHSPPFFG